MAKKPQAKVKEQYNVKITGPEGYTLDKLRGAVILAVGQISTERGKDAVFSIDGWVADDAK